MGGCGVDAGSTPAPRSVTLTVFAAASLAEAFEAVAEAFEAAHPGVTVRLHLAGSQQLAQQLRLGAPADVLATAGLVPMQVAVEAGRVAPGAPQVIARNRLVAVVPPGNPARLDRLADLARPGLRLVLADAVVPAGAYTQAFLEKASVPPGLGVDFGDRVRANVVSYEQNVRAVLTKVRLGEADAGIVYASDVVAAPDLVRLTIPETLNVEAVYPIAPLVDSPRPAEAQAFVAFVCSPEGRRLLARHGLLPPPAS
ncbi:MAG: molybdate ABC transporter substrate-binding protein [Bacteroidetes bacterium]|nr:MAG: molybdate ABC transporter substrate-binding protein [Bacteroidota bacterium]